MPDRYTNLRARARIRGREFVASVVRLPLVSAATRARVLQSVLRHRTVGARVNPFVRIVGPGRLSLGTGAFVNCECYFDLSADVTLGPKVHLAPRVAIYTSTHRVGSPDCMAGELVTGPVSIGAGSWIGAGAIILPGVSVAPGILVGAGSVVTRDLLEPGVYIGTPAVWVRGAPRAA